MVSVARGRAFAAEFAVVRGALVAARTVNRDVTTMHINQMLHDREAQTEPSMHARASRVRLTKTIQHEGNKLGRNTDAGV